MIEPKFEWTKNVFQRQIGSGPLHSACSYYADVVTPGFVIKCAVLPFVGGPGFGWMMRPALSESEEFTWNRTEPAVGWKRELTGDAADAIADLENYIRAQLNRCYAGRTSAFDHWRPAISREFLDRQRARLNPVRAYSPGATISLFELGTENRWSKEPDPHPELRREQTYGGIRLTAVVQSTGFHIRCVVHPSRLREGYVWACGPIFAHDDGWVSIKNFVHVSTSVFPDPTSARTHCERTLRAQVKKCYGGQQSVFDTWRTRIAQRSRVAAPSGKAVVVRGSAHGEECIMVPE